MEKSIEELREEDRKLLGRLNLLRWACIVAYAVFVLVCFAQENKLWLLLIVPLTYMFYNIMSAANEARKSLITAELFAQAAEKLREPSDECVKYITEDMIECSPIVIGTFDGQPIYEWIIAPNPFTNEREKFFYHSPVRYDKDGVMIFSTEEDAIVAQFNGIIYIRSANA